MKKNLFLTLALALASFVGVNAQNWSVTLGAAEGLPGEEVTLDKANVTYYKSGIISADKAIKTLRFSVAGTRNNGKGTNSANNVVFALSELNVYDANDLTKELSYTVKSNADHNTITKSFDGQGLRALYDGSYDNFFHSMWAADGAVTDYHHLELTFEEPIERFIIEWGGRPNNHNNNPTIVVLTEGGVTAEPYTDRSSSFSEEKISTLAALEEEAYFTIRGNAPSSYHEYNNSTGEQTSKEPVEGSGPMYVTLGSTYAAEPTSDYLTKLVPAGDDTYYIYFPMQKQYLNGDMSDNQYNDKHNGWQYATADIKKAAKVTLHELANGDFEMSYETVYNNEDITVYVAADPRTGKMKTFSPANKAALEANGWCQGFGLVCTFNWSFYKADYQAPAWANEYEIGLLYLSVQKFHDAIKDAEAAADYVADVESSIADMEDAMADIKNMNIDDINILINEVKVAVGDAIYGIADTEAYTVMTYKWDEWNSNAGDGLQWTRAAYNTHIKPGVDLMTEIEDADDYFAYLEALTDYFTNKEYNTNKFLASEFQGRNLPMEFNNLQNTTVEQVLEVSIEEPVNGFRWTMLENHSGNKNSAGYQFTSCAELEVIDNTTGAKIALDATRISSNSNQSGEGTIAGLIDGFKSEDGYTGEQYGWYWHSIWGGGAHNPDGEVFLDVQFPDGVALSNFTIKFTSRGNQLHNAPKTVVISEYGKDHADGETVANPYNVKIGAQVTDAAKLVDGGLYVIQGNLNVKKTEAPAQPRYYAGTRPFGSDANLAADAPCVYMFKKAGDGWKILSLANGQYWVEEPAYGADNLTIYQGKAGALKIAKSNNIANAFVMYRDIEPDTAKGSFKDEEKGVEVAETEIIRTKLVYMDWDGGLAARECYSEMPGVLAPGCEALTDEFKVTSAAGDYLHFNKTNGEGEWNIYEATMNDQYYAYLQGLVEAAKGANLIVGANPGSIAADEATTTRFNNAKAAAEVAVNAEDKANAEAVATEYAAAIEAFANSEVVGFDPAAVYRIESALENFLKNTWYTRSIYTKGNTLEWTVTPENFENENHEFLFRISNDADELEAEEVEVAEDAADKTYIIQSIRVGKYIGQEFACANRPAPYVIEQLATCVYNIKTADGQVWHANNHQSGNGYGSNLVYYGGGVNSASAWTFIYMGEAADYPLSVEEVVVKGDEVVSVSYYTAAGMAISEPVKGINIVVTTYANGVVEAKKVLVK